MRLQDYLDREELTQAAFATRHGFSRMSVSRWTRGISIPTPDAMERLMAATKQAVRPGDFYPRRAA